MSAVLWLLSAILPCGELARGLWPWLWAVVLEVALRAVVYLPSCICVLVYTHCFLSDSERVKRAWKHMYSFTCEVSGTVCTLRPGRPRMMMEAASAFAEIDLVVSNWLAYSQR